jgi:hypothetical protein
MVFGDANIDSIGNNIGFTGIKKDWDYVGICWSYGKGEPPFPLNNELYVRFVFISDSLSSTQQEGWMIDNLGAFTSIVDFVSSPLKDKLSFFNIYPNPAAEDLTVEISLNSKSLVNLSIVDLQGRVMKTIVNESAGPGKITYTTGLQGIPVNEMMFIRLSVNNAQVARQFLRLQ